MGVNLRSLPLIWPLNSILPRGFPPENRPGRLNHVCVSPVNELPDDPPLLYSRLTAPVDFKRTLHHSHCPAPQGLSAVSGEMVLERLKIRQLVTSMRLLSAIGRGFPFPVWRMWIWSCIKDCFKFPILCVYVWCNLLRSWNLGLKAGFVYICQVIVRCITSLLFFFCFHWIVMFFTTLAATTKRCKKMQKVYKVMCLDWAILCEQFSVSPLLWGHWIVRDSVLVLESVTTGGLVSFEIRALTLC